LRGKMELGATVDWNFQFRDSGLGEHAQLGHRG
jgi:hypothetical protein